MSLLKVNKPRPGKPKDFFFGQRPALPSIPSAARTANESVREAGSGREKRLKVIGWPSKAMETSDLRKSCSLRSGTILDPNWKVKRTFGFERLIDQIMHDSHSLSPFRLVWWKMNLQPADNKNVSPEQWMDSRGHTLHAIHAINNVHNYYVLLFFLKKN